MLPNFLIPETLIRESGKGSVLELPEKVKTLVVTLGINRIVEQESLDVSIVGSHDGITWDPKPLLRFPQKFYCGTYTMVLDLSQSPGVRYLRAEYKAGRWGRGDAQPLFGFYVFIEDVISKSTASRAVA